MSRSASIKNSLLSHFLLIIVLLGGAILITTYFGGRQVVRQLSTSLIEHTIEHTESRLQSFFRPITSELLLARSWGKRGVLDADKPDYMRKLLSPVLTRFRQISSLMVADSRGREFMLLRSGSNWFNRVVKRDLWHSKVSWYTWTDSKPEPKRAWGKTDYDPRTRPWFMGAKREILRQGASSRPQKQFVHWTQPYTFYTSKQPGITASIVYDLGDNINRVVGFDVSLSEISRFTTSLKLSENGKVVILTDDTRIIGLPHDPRYRDQKNIRADLLKRPSELSNSLVDDAVTAYTARTFVESSTSQGLNLDKKPRGPVRFKSNGQVWLAEFRHFSLSDNRSLLIAALIPEKDLIGDLSRLRIWILVITLTFMGVGIFRSFVLARRYSTPIETLMRQSERISRGLLYEGPPVESSITEVQRLADAHEKMRVALQSLLKLERDLQLARQIQQNTFPKNLPVLPGFDICAWSQPAEETGGDTYDVIGFREVGDKRVFQTDDDPECAVLLMADATGHGIGPALSAHEVRSMLRMAVRTGETMPSIADHINQQLYQDLHAGRFITSWLCLLDTRDCSLTHFSAGQAPIIHFIRSRQEFDIMPADSPPFGVVEDLGVEFGDSVILDEGDLFAVMSDGVFEAVNEQGEQFTLDRVLDILRENQDRNCEDIMSALRQKLTEFTRNAPTLDDQTVVLVKGTGKACAGREGQTDK